MEHPYYISWTKQKDASTFDITQVEGCKIHSLKNGSPHVLYDMTSISYQAHFGHNHPVIIAEIKKQLDTIPMSSPKGVYPTKDETTSQLLSYMQKEEGKIFYTTGGAETIENALKIARHVTKKKIVLARSNSYHGATLGALAVTGDWRNPPHLIPGDWVKRIPEPEDDPTLSITESIIVDIGAENIAAIILETITGGNGVIIPTKEWWSKLSSLCKKHHILLIMDEVVCGFERTGKSFGYNHFDVEPDMICLAKGITGGMIPFGALWTSKRISDFYQEEVLVCGLTNYAHPLGIAALRGVLNIVTDQKFQETCKKGATLFQQSINDLKKFKVVNDVRVIGHLAAIDLHQTIEWKEFFNEGLYLVSQKNRIILAPPLIMTEAELSEAMAKIQNVLSKFA